MAKKAATKSELEIARIVWELGNATVREVLDALPDEREIDFWTVQTFLRRLTRKGYLRARREGRANVYSPAVQPQKVVREVTDDLIDRLFGGNAVPMFQHLIHDRGLTDEELDELQRALDEAKARKAEAAKPRLSNKRRRK